MVYLFYDIGSGILLIITLGIGLLIKMELMNPVMVYLGVTIIFGELTTIYLINYINLYHTLELMDYIFFP